MFIKIKLLFAVVFASVNPITHNVNGLEKLDEGIKKNATLIELMEKYEYKHNIDTTHYEYIDLSE